MVQVFLDTCNTNVVNLLPLQEYTDVHEVREALKCIYDLDYEVQYAITNFI